MADPAQQPVLMSGWRAPLLPAGVLPGHGAKRSARDWAVDLVMFAFAAAVGAGVLAQSWRHQTDLQRGLDLVLGLIALGLLWVRRRHPLGVALFVLTVSTFSGLAAGAAVVAAFSAAIRVETRFLLPVTVLLLAGAAIYPTWYPNGDSYVVQLVVGMLFCVLTMGWGLFVRAQRDYVAALHARAAHLDEERRLHVEAAREAERRRIAGEMHDVLAHRISLLSVHAGALEFHPDAPPEEIAAAASVIRASARAALEELRAVVGVLREEHPSGEPEPPQPTLADTPALVEESRAAGMHVRWTAGPPMDVDGSAARGRTAYRVLQEGLTNARKHAPDAAVDVAIRPGDDGTLVVEVISRPPIAPPQHDALPGAGTGLVGLAERVELAGGTLEHGPNASGNFVLRAVLPESGPG